MLTRMIVFMLASFGVLVCSASGVPSVPDGNAREQGISTATGQVLSNDHTQTAGAILEQLGALSMPQDAGVHPVPPVVDDPPGSSGVNVLNTDSQKSGLETALENIGLDNPGLAPDVLEQLLDGTIPPHFGGGSGPDGNTGLDIALENVLANDNAGMAALVLEQLLADNRPPDVGGGSAGLSGFDTVAAIPEPATLGLLLLGGLALLRRRRPA